MSLILPRYRTIYMYLMGLQSPEQRSAELTDEGRFCVARGWGAVSYAANNTIVGNSCHDYKTLLNDGGCIYSTAQRSGRLFASSLVVSVLFSL